MNSSSEEATQSAGRATGSASLAGDPVCRAEEFLGLLWRLGERLHAGLARDLEPELGGVTAHQLKALSCLAARETDTAPRAARAVTMQELAEWQGIGLSTATALADRLLRQGLVERAHDPNDRRVVRLLPTEHALDLIARYGAAKRELAVRALDALDDDEAETLIRLLRRVTAGGDHGDGA